MVPPVSFVLKEVSRSSSRADAAGMVERVSMRGYFLRYHVSIQKLSMRTISFCSSPIEPDTSII